MTSSQRKWHHGFNLQLWELGPVTVVGVCVAIAEKGHLTLWLAISGCRVVGSANKKNKGNSGIFFALSQNSNHPFHDCTLYSFTLSDKSKGVFKVITMKQNQQQGNKGRRTNNSQYRKLAFWALVFLVKFSQVNNILRVKGWTHIFTKITLMSEHFRN